MLMRLHHGDTINGNDVIAGDEDIMWFFRELRYPYFLEGEFLGLLGVGSYVCRSAASGQMTIDKMTNFSTLYSAVFAFFEAILGVSCLCKSSPKGWRGNFATWILEHCLKFIGWTTYSDLWVQIVWGGKNIFVPQCI